MKRRRYRKRRNYISRITNAFIKLFKNIFPPVFQHTFGALVIIILLSGYSSDKVIGNMNSMDNIVLFKISQLIGKAVKIWGGIL